MCHANDMDLDDQLKPNLSAIVIALTKSTESDARCSHVDMAHLHFYTVTHKVGDVSFCRKSGGNTVTHNG